MILNQKEDDGPGLIRRNMQDGRKESTQDALLSLVQGKEGKHWSKSVGGWSKDSRWDICYWEGVQCDPDNVARVIGIFLPDVGISGTLPEKIGEIKSLRQLSLPRNNIRGSIPSGIANLPELEVLNLSRNQLTGEIPNIWSSKLEIFNVGHNLLSGALHLNLNLTTESLTEFDVQNNGISGEIPDYFSRMTSLQLLSLSANLLTGTIPSNLGSEDLAFLFLDSNLLMGTIPAQLFSEKSTMKELWLQQNLFSGTLPAKLAKLENLKSFYIDGNKFTGTVPPELCQKELNDEFYKDALEEPNRENCDSISCPVGEFSVDGFYPCLSCEKSYFDPYIGRVGKCVDMNENDILNAFNKAVGGNLWSGKHHCQFEGVTCDNQERVIGISLHKKGLIGTIPPELGFLSYLGTLDLRDNMLTGVIPSDLRFTPLGLLDLTGNNLIGVVPEMLCLKAGINGNGANGDFSCDNIVCAVGTYSASGKSYLNTNGERHCLPCAKGNLFLGNKKCISDLNFTDLHMEDIGLMRAKDLAGGFFSTLLGLATFVFIVHILVDRVVIVRKWGSTKGIIQLSDADLTVVNDEKDCHHSEKSID